MVEIAVKEEWNKKQGDYKDEIGAIEEDLAPFVKDSLEERVNNRRKFD